MIIAPAKHEASSSPGLWMPNAAPRKVFAVAAFIVLISILCIASLITRQPALGVTWSPSPGDNGLIVRIVSIDIPGLASGIRVVSIKNPGGNTIRLHNDMLLEDPDHYATYEPYNRFFKEQRELTQILSHDQIQLTTSDGQILSVSTGYQRSLVRLPPSFWLLNFSGALCLLIGVGVWCYRRGNPTTRILAVSGLAFFAGMLCLSVYGPRELAMDADWFLALSIANHFCMILFSYSLLLLFLYYPQRIGTWREIVIAYLVIPLLWLNQAMQWIEPPIHAYYLPNHIVPYVICIGLGFIQWKKTKKRPVERAALRWFLLSIWICIGVAICLGVVPEVLPRFYSGSLCVGAFIVLLMFIGFAFGILRYGFFQLERWWFAGWVWLISGFLIAAIDMLLIFTLDVKFKTILPISVIALGWLYFPSRQWLWKRLVRPDEYNLENQLPKMIQSLFAKGTLQSFLDQWSQLLAQIFNPLDIKARKSSKTGIATTQHGLVLQVPGLDGKHIYELTGNHQGSRLFGTHDVVLAKAILNLAEAILSITTQVREVQQKGAAVERDRIMRDLHDDVLPKLITLKQRSGALLEGLADAACQSLRDTIYILRNTSEKPMDEIMADWRAELSERLESTPIQLEWNVPDPMDRHLLTARQQISCGRILREAVSNVLAHTGAGRIAVGISTNNGHLNMYISDNGVYANMSSGKKEGGIGTSNMRLRARNLGGSIRWVPNRTGSHRWSSGVTVEVSFPLAQNSPTQEL
jgi:signal transduction histidine kinase